MQASTTRLQQTLTGLLARSPFSSALRRDRHSVVAFELDWAHTVGLQYENELCHDGRLVMEVHGVTRREFSSVGVSMGCTCRTADWHCADAGCPDQPQQHCHQNTQAVPAASVRRPGMPHETIHAGSWGGAAVPSLPSVQVRACILHLQVEEARTFYLGSAGGENLPKPTRAHSEGSLAAAISALEQDLPDTDHLHKSGSPPGGEREACASHWRHRPDQVTAPHGGCMSGIS